MNLERLANDVFLGGICTLRVFSPLNSRFDALPIISFRTDPLDFSGSSTDDFDLICRENLSSMIEQMTGLRLSADNDPPPRIKSICHSFVVGLSVD